MAGRSRAEPGRWGTLYGVGLGPGDPELLTLKARRIIRAVPTLVVPVRRLGEPSFAWSIAEPHLRSRRQRVIWLPFPQDSGDPVLEAQWDRNGAEVARALARGRDAAFLTEGDPLFYSTFVHLAARLTARWPEVRVEVVPGVTSMTAAAAAAGEPLVVRGDRLAVLPAVYDLAALERVLREFDTVVLLKVNRVLDRLVTTLERLGLAERAVLVERCGRPEQRVVRGLQAALERDVDYFSLVIVRAGAGGVGQPS